MEALGFDDVLLVPTYSEVKSRNDVSLSVELPKGVTVESPLVPANMKSVVSTKLAYQALKNGSLVLLHRFALLGVLAEDFQSLLDSDLTPEQKRRLGVSVGVKESDYTTVNMWLTRGADIFCIDVAHADHFLCLDMIKYIKDKSPWSMIIAGNVCTANGAESLWAAGADIIKVGVGPGAACTTRLATGCGYPQFSALEEIWKRKNDIEFAYSHRKIGIIADGGIRYPGDAAKALIFADLVMMGWEFARCEEAGNEGYYSGSSTHKNEYVEGTTKFNPVYPTGGIDGLYQRYHQGIRSACSYLGGRDLDSIKGSPYVRVSQSEQRRDRDK